RSHPRGTPDRRATAGGGRPPREASPRASRGPGTIRESRLRTPPSGAPCLPPDHRRGTLHLDVGTRFPSVVPKTGPDPEVARCPRPRAYGDGDPAGSAGHRALPGAPRPGPRGRV